MSIRVVAEGTVMTEPAVIGSDRGRVVAFILGTRHELVYRDQRVELDGLETCEVVCAGDSASAALRVQVDTRVVVTGTLRIQSDASQMGQDLGAQLVRLEIHAADIAVA